MINRYNILVGDTQQKRELTWRDNIIAAGLEYLKFRVQWWAFVITVVNIQFL